MRSSFFRRCNRLLSGGKIIVSGHGTLATKVGAFLFCILAEGPEVDRNGEGPVLVVGCAMTISRDGK